MLIISGIRGTQALIISEVMSNPIGDDSGREWIELYNNDTQAVDISTLTISIKGGTPVVATPLSGNMNILPGAYVIIGSTVSGATKFAQDYPSYMGALFKSSISLVNTGTTSIDIKIGGTTVDSLSSYTAAKEGYTLSLVGGSFVQGTPTPGATNQADVSSSTAGTDTTTTSTDTGNQISVSQVNASKVNMFMYMPFEQTVVAGADTSFKVSAASYAGKAIDNLTCIWAFGDGGQGTGTSTTYRYAYTGRYVILNECTNGILVGLGRTVAHVVAPDVTIQKIDTGKYGTFIDITNPNDYDLDFSQWRLSIDGAYFTFPKNTLISRMTTTRLSGVAMGFASTTVATSTVIKLLFPSLEEIITYRVADTHAPTVLDVATSTLPLHTAPPQVVARKVTPLQKKTIAPTSTTTGVAVTTTTSSQVKTNKDTRLATWITSLFSR